MNGKEDETSGDHFPQPPIRLAWWHYGLMGAVCLSLVTVAGAVYKVPIALMRGQTIPWGGFLEFATGLLAAGFVLGVLVWVGQILAGRLGNRLADAVSGLLVGVSSVLLCMWLFKPESLTPLSLLALGSVLGPIMGLWIGDGLRKELRKELTHKPTE